MRVNGKKSEACVVTLVMAATAATTFALAQKLLIDEEDKITGEGRPKVMSIFLQFAGLL